MNPADRWIKKRGKGMEKRVNHRDQTFANYCFIVGRKKSHLKDKKHQRSDYEKKIYDRKERVSPTFYKK